MEAALARREDTQTLDALESRPCRYCSQPVGHRFHRKLRLVACSNEECQRLRVLAKNRRWYKLSVSATLRKPKPVIYGPRPCNRCGRIYRGPTRLLCNACFKGRN